MLLPTRIVRTLRLEMSLAEAKKLLEAVENYEDEGPLNEGWPSAALEQVRFVVRETVHQVWGKGAF